MVQYRCRINIDALERGCTIDVYKRQLYDIPESYLSDETFAAMMAEAEKYIGLSLIHIY